MQYSLKYNQVSCTACHYSPAGGGPRTEAGKLFGAHNLEFNPLLAQNYVSADFRALYYWPQETAGSRDGMGIMSASLAAHASLDQKRRVQLVIEHNIAGFAAASYRDTYALFRFPKKIVNSVMVGRFRIPFGIVTDEHRTYTRMQTSTEWFAMETGIMASGTPTAAFHYDLALLNGTHANGSSLAAGQAGHWGSAVNLRFLRNPHLMGASASYFKTGAGMGTKQRAWTLYGGATWQRWTMLVEFVRAEGFNSNLSRGFVSNPAYAASIEGSISHGWLAWLEYEVSQDIFLNYKFDFLTPDQNYPADVFERHGLGVKWNLAPFVWLMARAEKARATHPTEKTGYGAGRLDAAYALLQLSF